jgi:hypothetical protein
MLFLLFFKDGLIQRISTSHDPDFYLDVFCLVKKITVFRRGKRNFLQ